MNTLNILGIGNSFTEDAAAYIHQMAEVAGYDVQIVTLYIGGCPLEKHWLNIENDGVYMYQRNGVKSSLYVTIDEALKMEQWDIIVTQQASHDSGWICTYEPFLPLLIDHIKKLSPSSKLYLQETWAYEIDSSHSNFMRYNRNQQLMYNRLHDCYTQMAEKYHLGLIPSGTIIQKLRQTPAFHVQSGGLSLCRDGFHMSFDYGRYVLACVWLKTLLGLNLEAINYVPDPTEVENAVDAELLQTLRRTVDALLDR